MYKRFIKPYCKQTEELEKNNVGKKACIVTQIVQELINS